MGLGGGKRCGHPASTGPSMNQANTVPGILRSWMPPHTETSVGWSSFHSRGLDLILIFNAQVLEGQLAKNAGIKKKKKENV